MFKTAVATKKKGSNYEFVRVEDFPVELLTLIFAYLDVESLCRASMVSLQFRQIGELDSLWLRFCSVHPKRIKNTTSDLKKLFIHFYVKEPLSQQLRRRKHFQLMSQLKYGSYEIRVSFLGDFSTGKGSDIQTLAFLPFGLTEENENESFYNLNVTLKDSKNAPRSCYFTLIDAPGDHSLYSDEYARIAFKEIDIFVVCIDSNDDSTIDSAINFWIPLIKIHAIDAPFLFGECDEFSLDDLDRDQLDFQDPIEKFKEVPRYCMSSVSFLQSLYDYKIKYEQKLEIVQDEDRSSKSQKCILQ